MADDPYETIIEMEQRRRQYMLATNVVGLQELLSDDLVYVHSSGLVDTKTSYLGHLSQGHLRYLSIDMDQLQARLAGDVALVHGRMRAQLEIMGQPRSVETLFLTVWSRPIDGTWQLRSHQGTPVVT